MLFNLKNKLNNFNNVLFIIIEHNCICIKLHMYTN